MRSGLGAAAVAGFMTVCASLTPTAAATSDVYLDTKAESCKANNCLVVFKIPVTKNGVAFPLVVKSVSCNITFPGALSVSFTGTQIGFSNESGDFSDGQYLGTVYPIGNTPDAYVVQILADTLHVIPAGRHPTIQLGLTGKAKMSALCTIAGTATP